MKAEQLPFPTGWWSFELPGYRPCAGTYCWFPYESIPPLNMQVLRGGFQWLDALDDSLRQTLSVYRSPKETRNKLAANLRQLVAEADALGLTLPEAFLQFMAEPDLQDQIPSCTACYFDLSEHLIASSVVQDGYFVRFMNDQQGVLFWYLYVSLSGDHGVLVSPIRLDDKESDGLTVEQIIGHTYFCASSFEEFVYRFWLENQIWFGLGEGRRLTDEQKRYVAYYGGAPQSSG